MKRLVIIIIVLCGVNYIEEVDGFNCAAEVTSKCEAMMSSIKGCKRDTSKKYDPMTWALELKPYCEDWLSKSASRLFDKIEGECVTHKVLGKRCKLVDSAYRECLKNKQVTRIDRDKLYSLLRICFDIAEADAEIGASYFG